MEPQLTTIQEILTTTSHVSMGTGHGGFVVLKSITAVRKIRIIGGNWQKELHYDFHFCNFGIRLGAKPPVLVYDPKKYGYDGKSTPISKEAILKAFKYAEKYMNDHYRKDAHLGRNEDDPSYWGNGCAQEDYNSEVKAYGDTGYYLGVVTEYLSKE